MRICIISRAFPPGVGGAETYAYELANTLGERDHQVDVYTQWINSPDENIDINNNVTVHRIAKSRRNLATFSTIYFSMKARKIIDPTKYDIIHGMLMPASTIAVGPFNEFDTPVVLTSHGTSLDEAKAVALETPGDYALKFFFHPMNVIMDRIAGHYSDEIIAISDHAHDVLLNSYKFKSEKVHIIPHGVDTNKFYPREGCHPAIDPGKNTVLYVGRLGARKGISLALQAIARTYDSEIEFVIAGEGRHKEHLTQLTSNLGLSNRVKFLGYVPDGELPLLYSSADVFILPSRYEGFGLVLLEAMACGTPVIGANVGGIPTAIDHNVNGLVIDRDVVQFARAIHQMMDEDYREKLRKNALSNADNMSWNSIVSSVEKLYDQVS